MKHSKKYYNSILTNPSILVFLIISIFINIFLYSRWQFAKNEVGTYKVSKVIDGDSIIIEGNQTIRLASIAAPELEFCLGNESKRYLEKLVRDKRIKVEFTSKDSYGRLMGLVYIEDKLVNEMVLEAGMARFDSSQTRADKILLSAEHRGQINKIGVFSRKCTQSIPPDSKCQIKANIDKKRGRRVYHYVGCVNYSSTIVELDRGESWFCTKKEAEKAGFNESEQCYR